jgi:type 1 glutamine amidotransferase
MKHFVFLFRVGLGIICAALLCASVGVAAPAESKIRILIFSGINNHNWKTTTPFLKKMYEDSGRFTVEVCNDVAALKPGDFDKYDVIVNNYTTWPNIVGHRWPAATEKAFLDYIAAGHGQVVVHAASTAWNDWPEFGDLIGLTWEKGKSGHGAQHSFVVKITDSNHPITKGMKDFQHVKDELYHRQIKHATAHLLATAYSDAAVKGSSADEPMIAVTEHGKGRVFHNAMGHDTNPMEGVGFKTLMLRGTEWAATGKVTIAIPANWPALGTPEAEAIKRAAAVVAPKKK